MKRNPFLLFALSSLVALSSLGVSATISWYVAASQLYIETIEFSVSSKQDLKVSLSPELDSFEEHKTGFVKGEDGNYSQKDPDTSLSLNAVSDMVFKPVSSMYSFHEDWYDKQSITTWMDEKSSTPLFYDSYVNLHSKVPLKPLVAKSGYFSKDIYLLSNYDCYVTLDPETSFFNGYRCTDEKGKPSRKKVASAVHNANKKKAETVYPYETAQTELSEEDYYESVALSMDDLYKAMRISLLDSSNDDYSYSIIDPFKEDETSFAGVLNLSPSDDYYDYYLEGSERKETLFGDIDEETRDKIVYSSPKERKDKESGKMDFRAGSVFDAETEEHTYHLEMEESIQNGLIYAKEHSYALSDQGSYDSQLMIPVYANRPKKITLSAYLEGWDRDCINNTMGAQFISTLSFMIAKEM